MAVLIHRAVRPVLIAVVTVIADKYLKGGENKKVNKTNNNAKEYDEVVSEVKLSQEEISDATSSASAQGSCGHTGSNSGR